MSTAKFCFRVFQAAYYGMCIVKCDKIVIFNAFFVIEEINIFVKSFLGYRYPIELYT